MQETNQEEAIAFFVMIEYKTKRTRFLRLLMARESVHGKKDDRMNNIKIGAAVAAMASAAGAAGAQVVLFEQLPDQFDAYMSDSTGHTPHQRIADTFTLGAGASIGTVEFWGMNGEPQELTDGFTIKFYNDVGGLPGALLYTEIVGAVPVNTTGQLISGAFPERHYTAELSVPFHASKGVGYFLSIVNDSFSGPQSDSWYWETSDQGDGAAISSNHGNNWSTLAKSFAFRLSGVPDPVCNNPADVNGDGLLTPADFSAWIAAFNAGDPECDQNGDGSCTPADFTAWIANYNAGC